MSDVPRRSRRRPRWISDALRGQYGRVQLVVTCGSHRLAVVCGDDRRVVARYVDIVKWFLSSGDPDGLPLVACPNHFPGHILDGGALTVATNIGGTVAIEVVAREAIVTPHGVICPSPQSTPGPLT